MLAFLETNVQMLLLNIKQAQANKNEADTGIPGADCGKNPSPRLFGQGGKKKAHCQHTSSTSPAPSPKITYLPNL
eukprot:1153264-Pelagomonas_calceolata.AAC.2